MLGSGLLMRKELWKFKRVLHPDRYMCPNINLPYFMPCSDLLNTHLRRLWASVILSHRLLWAIIERGGNPLGLRIDLNAGLGALA